LKVQHPSTVLAQIVLNPPPLSLFNHYNFSKLDYISTKKKDDRKVFPLQRKVRKFDETLVTVGGGHVGVSNMQAAGGGLAVSPIVGLSRFGQPHKLSIGASQHSHS
jgi:hypothetical protein